MTENPPAWTDHNTSDPGVTVLEVLAFGIATLGAVALVLGWWRCGRRQRGNSDASSGGC